MDEGVEGETNPGEFPLNSGLGIRCRDLPGLSDRVRLSGTAESFPIRQAGACPVLKGTCMPHAPKPLTVMQPYKEAGSAERLCAELSTLELGADILFCDDGSPDGTGEI